MITISAPTGPVCGGQFHPLEATCPDALTAKWTVIGMPSTVSADEVIFTAPQALQTEFLAPVEGIYTFAIECCTKAP